MRDVTICHEIEEFHYGVLEEKMRLQKEQHESSNQPCAVDGGENLESSAGLVFR